MAVFLKVARCRRMSIWFVMLVFAMYCTLYTGQIQMIPPVGEVFGRKAEHRNVTRDRDNALDGLIRSLQEATELAAAGEESTWFTPEVRER